jgi:alkylhydroperoxidase family enzyme
VQLNLVAAWREATVFTEVERAALELTEQGTRIADAAGGVTDEAWANAANHYNEEQIGALVSLIALINTYNRMDAPAAMNLAARHGGRRTASSIGARSAGPARRTIRRPAC